MKVLSRNRDSKFQARFIMSFLRIILTGLFIMSGNHGLLALEVAVTPDRIQRFLGGQGGVLVFTDADDNFKLKTVNFNEPKPKIRTLEKNRSFDPRLSLDGTRVCYGSEGVLYTRWLKGGDRVPLASVGKNKSRGVGYWYREHDVDYIVYCNSTHKRHFEKGMTFKQKLKDGIHPDGDPVLLYGKAYDGGITPDGKWIGEAYGRRHAYNLETKQEYGNFYRSNGSRERQCCNASMAPQAGPYRMATLVIPHRYFRVWEFHPGEDRWKEYRSFENPPGTKEWQNPDWSLHPDYITATAQGDDEAYDLYIQFVKKPEVRIKVLDGNIGTSHLYVGPANR